MWKEKKNHYNSRDSLHEAQTKSTRRIEGELGFALRINQRIMNLLSSVVHYKTRALHENHENKGHRTIYSNTLLCTCLFTASGYLDMTSQFVI